MNGMPFSGSCSINSLAPTRHQKDIKNILVELGTTHRFPGKKSIKRLSVDDGLVPCNQLASGGQSRMKNVIWIFLGAAILLFVVLVYPRVMTVAVKRISPVTEHPAPSVRSMPVPVSPCGPGLAAEDLSGHCRARPNPTPGALEAIDAPKKSAARKSTDPTPERKK
jgi:hypothetical protein